MKRSWIVCVLALVLILLLTGCGCEHEWFVATCSAPKTCSLCGQTEGEALPHTWQDADCVTPKTCSVCKLTEGEALGHTWQDATCTEVKVCTVCQVTEGEPLGHTWVEANCSAPKTCSVCKVTEGKTADHKWEAATTEAPKTCSVCKKTSGSKIKTDSRFTTKATKDLQGTWVTDVHMTDEMLGLENFGGLDCRLVMKFGNSGKLTSSMEIKDEKAFMSKYKQYTIDLTYAAFAQEGMNKTQADQAMLDAYGLNVNDYVEAALKSVDINKLFGAYFMEEVYYVEGDKVFTALSWKAKFESNAFKITGGKLVIEGVALEEGGKDLEWKKS